jgi:anti-sigma factor RsiW
MSCEAWAERLDAYVDGETAAPDVPALEEHLRACGECAAEALGRMQMKRATRAAAAMRFTPPPELRRRVEKSIAPQRKRWAFLMSPSWAMAGAMAVALALAIAVSSAVWLEHEAREQAIGQLLDMHVAALASANPVDVVSSDRHTVKPWFQGKLAFTFNLPELGGSPYTLDGGRLVYFRGQAGAQLIYQLRKHEFSVFIVPDGGAGSGGIADGKKNGFSTEAWSAGGLRYVVVSDAGEGDVHALGELMRSVQR